MEPKIFESIDHNLDQDKANSIPAFYSPDNKSQKESGYRRQITLDFPGNRLKRPADKSNPSTLEKKNLANESFSLEPKNLAHTILEGKAAKTNSKDCLEEEDYFSSSEDLENDGIQGRNPNL